MLVLQSTAYVEGRMTDTEDKPVASTEAPDSSNEQASEEQAWIAAALNGDGLAFRSLVTPHLPMLFRVCARACGSKEMAEDAVQEALLLAHERLGKLQKDVTFKAFLAGIAVKRARTLARGERRRNVRELASAEPSDLSGPEQDLEATRLSERIQEALASLPKKRRDAVTLRLDADLSFRQIGDALGSSEASARVLVHMGLKQIREALDKTDSKILSLEKDIRKEAS